MKSTRMHYLKDYKPKTDFTSLDELNSELGVHFLHPEEVTGEFTHDFNKEIPDDNVSADGALGD